MCRPTLQPVAGALLKLRPDAAKAKLFADDVTLRTRWGVIRPRIDIAGPRTPLSEVQLIEQLHVEPGRIADALEQLQRRSLVRRDDVIELTPAGEEDYERLVATRSARLSELLRGWDPHDHEELRQLVDKLSRDLVREMPAPS